MRGFNKFGAKKTTIDGIRFDSKKEANRYLELKLLKLGGNISHLELQPEFIIHDGFECRGKKYRVIKYRADFKYIENGQTIVEDVKGFKTPVYNIKKKMFLKKYGNDLLFIES